MPGLAMAADVQTQIWTQRNRPPPRDGAEAARSSTKELHEEPTRYPHSHCPHETRVSTTLTSRSQGLQPSATARGDHPRKPPPTAPYPPRPPVPYGDGRAGGGWGIRKADSLKSAQISPGRSGSTLPPETWGCRAGRRACKKREHAPSPGRWGMRPSRLEHTDQILKSAALSTTYRGPVLAEHRTSHTSAQRSAHPRNSRHALASKHRTGPHPVAPPSRSESDWP